MYPALHHLHMTSAVISILFFMVRGYWMIAESSLLQTKFVKIAPHVIDTILLATAIGLTLVISQYPFVDDWLTAKLIALIVYIGLGTIAIKRGKTKSQRIIAMIAAIVVFGYILSVAITRNPMGFLNALV